MEKILNQDERIRKAEELYERRKLQNEIRKNTVVQKEETKIRSKRKLLLQSIICILIYFIFCLSQKIPNIISTEVMYKVTDILEYDINFRKIYENFQIYIKDKNEQKTVNEITENQDENIQKDNAEANEIQEELVQTEKITEETTELSEMEINAQYIINNYSVIKPLEGEITSRFGFRNSTNPAIPKNHTGIDIARPEGTVIIAATDGKVELVSSEGDLGNHLRIVNNDISTTYAHCSKIYVAEGENVIQGQEIAEVGETGNATGPHLHFEIRRDNNLINPDLILQF